MPMVTEAQLAGRCTALSPIPIGKSSASDSSGPNVAIGASIKGVVAAWFSSDAEVTTIPLDSAGQPRGEGRTLKSEIGVTFPRLWELGDGMFVLGFAPDRSHLSLHFRVKAPRSALQRVDATGELVGKPVTFPLEYVKDVTHFQNELRLLTGWSTKREMLRVAASKDGLTVMQVALPESPAGEKRGSVQERLLVTSKGAARVLTDFGDGVWVVDREEGGRVEVKLPKEYHFYKRPVLDAEGEVLWPSCGKPPNARAIKAGSGGIVEIEVDAGVCEPSPPLLVHADYNPYNGKSRGIIFQPAAPEPAIKLSPEARQYWWVASTWTGTHVVAVYAQGRRGAWTIVAHPILCEGKPS
jgi:hypothetical protein